MQNWIAVHEAVNYFVFGSHVALYHLSSSGSECSSFRLCSCSDMWISRMKARQSAVPSLLLSCQSELELKFSARGVRPVHFKWTNPSKGMEGMEQWCSKWPCFPLTGDRGQICKSVPYQVFLTVSSSFSLDLPLDFGGILQMILMCSSLRRKPWFSCDSFWDYAFFGSSPFLRVPSWEKCGNSAVRI